LIEIYCKEKMVFMNLDAIHLVNLYDQFFLIDSHVCKPVLISAKAYQILNAYKNGVELIKLHEEFGKTLVDSIVKEIASLREKNIISDTNNDFYSMAKSVISQLSERKKPSLTDGVFMIAQNCNMACKYCYGGNAGSYNSKGLMSRQMAKDFLCYFLSTGEDRPYQNVVFFGGEPLLNMDVIVYIIELWEKWKFKYKGRKLKFSLTTNGTLLTPKITEYIKKKEISISISLDGPEEIHNAYRVFPDGQGSFSKVMEGIGLLRKYKIPFSVRSTACRYNYSDDIFNIFDEQNFDNVGIEPVTYPSLYPKKDYQMDAAALSKFSSKYRELKQQGCIDIINDKKDSFKGKLTSASIMNIRSRNKEAPFKCMAGIGIAAFDINGDIYPCQRFVGNKPFQIGSVRQGIDMEKVATILNNFLEASKSCNSCWAVSICGCKCLNQKATMNGDFEQIPEQICNIYREDYASALITFKDLINHEKSNKYIGGIYV
jgi:radical SAM additional 4Fe4S-binding domain